MMTRRGIAAKGLAAAGCALCSVLGRAGLGGAGLEGAGLGGTARASAAEPSMIEGPGYRLWHVGGMRDTIMGGRRDSLLDLRALSGRPGLHALGPLEGLRGEVTVVDGRPSLARVSPEGGLRVSETFEGGAPFLVWAEVAGWRGKPLPDEVRSYADLERFLDRTAGEAGGGRAFPFRITGRFPSVGFHVVDAPPGHPAGMAGHADIQRRFETIDRLATLVGFWSRDHQGVFTPMGSNIHVHVQAADNATSGHVEAIRLGSALEIMLPAA